MVVHRRKKSRKKSYKKSGSGRRGAGNRGGRGAAGFGKRAAHRKMTAMELGRLPGYDNKGFTSIFQKFGKKPKVITIERINEILWKKKLKGEPLEVDVTELGYDKVIGRGFLMFPAVIKARAFSKGAREKIERAGGRAIEIC